VDGSGSAYITGNTGSTDFPVTPGAFQTSPRGDFVTKLNAAGTGLVYSTYLGSRGGDSISGIAVDGSGGAYITGSTNSTDFPTTLGAFQTTLRGARNAFVTKLNAAGTGLVYSTYVGGRGGDYAYGIALGDSGAAYITGRTDSTNFPTTPGAFQTKLKGTSGNAFVTKLNASGSALVYSTYLGGSGRDQGSSIAVDASGDAYVTGQTGSFDFPTTPGAFQTALRGGGDAFITKLNASGAALVYSTFLGGARDDFGTGIGVDSAGDAYITGYTFSANFPIRNAFQPTYGGAGNAFVTEINPGGSALVYSTYLGGSNGDYGFGIAVDTSGNAYVTGRTASGDFPTKNAFQPTNHGNTNAFVAKFPYFGIATHLGVSAPASTTAGVGVSVTVTALSEDDNPDAKYRGTIHFTGNDPQANLPSDYTFTAADKGCIFST
jgi:hypothetical protein